MRCSLIFFFSLIAFVLPHNYQVFSFLSPGSSMPTLLHSIHVAHSPSLILFSNRHLSCSLPIHNHEFLLPPCMCSLHISEFLSYVCVPFTYLGSFLMYVFPLQSLSIFLSGKIILSRIPAVYGYIILAQLLYSQLFDP